MQSWLLEYLRCPYSRTKLRIQIIKTEEKAYENETIVVIKEAILFADEYWFYPVTNGIPRMSLDSFLDHSIFLSTHLPDYDDKKSILLDHFGTIIKKVKSQNNQTKKAFNAEWKFFNYEKDKTWNANELGMIDRFLNETDETLETLNNKIIFDAGCGNGKLNSLLGKNSIRNIGIDLSSHIDQCYIQNKWSQTAFIEGDIQSPPVKFEAFDIVHCSGVLIHTANPELSFSYIAPLTKPNGKLSVWLYHPRKNFIHNFFNLLRKGTSKLPIQIQFILYCITLFPLSYLIKRIKGNQQNTREMMLQIFDWFSPEYRWEFHSAEVKAWYYKRDFMKIKCTTKDLFGFNMIGEKIIK